MADFIAVIRRAVDGLTDNTPEMRAKVYERARAAVVRQLENMKPQPPEAMFQKQLDKLDAAIREVEAQHAGPLPAGAEEPEMYAAASEPDEPPVESESEAPATIAQPSEPHQQDEDATEPAEAAQALSSESVVETSSQPTDEAREEESVETAAPVEDRIDERTEEELPAEGAYAQDAVGQQQAAEDEQDAADEQTYYREELREPFEAENHSSEGYAHLAETAQHPEESADFADNRDHFVSEKQAYAEPVETFPEEPVAHATEPGLEAHEPVETHDGPEPVTDEVPPPMPRVSYDESDVVSGFNAFVQEEMNRQVVPPPPGRKDEPPPGDFSWDAPFDDLPEMPRPEAFDQALKAKQDEIAHASQTAPADEEAIRDPRAELEQLIGFDPYQKQSDTGSESALAEDTLPAPNTRDTESFNLPKENKKKGSIGRVVLTAAIALITAGVLGGSAYGIWYYRDDVSRIIASLMPSDKQDKPVEKKASDAGAKPDIQKQADKQATVDTKGTEVASLDPNATQKFTQRLLPNGKETSSDTPQVPVDQALIEGKSVAQQTEKPKEVAQSGNEANTAAQPTTANAGTSDANTAANSQVSGSGEKMFLYEERLGQGTPVASPGTVNWTEKSDETDGKPMPSIEAQVTVPGRNMKALISFKKNGDASLPASHVIEIVFDLPKDFEEGNVEGVQKVAFKQTEQDAGNPLIAVPAKITDDFHMVALNSDPEAQKVNVELMKSRPWIDIPITYRNGRRGLITLEKGKSGDAIFRKVMTEWDALGSATIDK